MSTEHGKHNEGTGPWGYPSNYYIQNVHYVVFNIHVYTSLPCQKAIFIRPPLFQYNGRLLGQKAGVACLYMPQDGYWLAGFEIYPPKKLALHRPKKSKFPFENCCFCLVYAKENQAKKKKSGFVVGKFRHADLDTSEQQAILLEKKGESSGQSCVFLCFRRKFCHAVLDFREQHVGLPDLFDHARSIAIAGATVR